jgi:hypothetical protein
LTCLYIIYENERKEKEIAKYKRMNKQKLWLDFILYMKMKERKKEIAEWKRTNQQKLWLDFILYMKMKERKGKERNI